DHAPGTAARRPDRAAHAAPDRDQRRGLRGAALRAARAAARARSLGARVELAALAHELDRLFLHPLLQRGLRVDAELARVVAHVLGDLHRTEVRPAHRAEVRQLRALLGQRLVVELARLVGIETEVELILPAELEPRLR